MNTELPKTFDPHLHVRELVLVGVGGTGAHLARLLARLLSHLRALGVQTPTLHLIDPDIVTSANIGRQLYSPADVGQPKAHVCARRLSLALGLDVRASVADFDPLQHLPQASHTILIDAVDNAAARQVLASTRAGVTITCGNERHFGQVGIGTDHDRAALCAHLAEVRSREATLGSCATLRRLPTAYALFPELLNPPPPAALPVETGAASCAARLLAGEQDVYVNDLVALVAARYVAQVLTRQPIESFLTFVNLQGSLSVRPVPITLSNLDAYLGAHEETPSLAASAGHVV